MKFIKQARREDHEKIEALRISEFQRSAQFTLLKPEKLKWNGCDETATVLSAWDGDCLVATMRGVLVNNTAEAEECVQCTVPTATDFPALVFNNAATHYDYRGIGLNQLLRYYFLKIALANGIQSLLSPMYEGAPRLRFMKELGYTFTVPSLSWQNKLNAKATRILGILRRAMMPRAIEVIDTHRNEIITAYPWQGKHVRLTKTFLEKCSTVAFQLSSGL